jgi:drug/metabolite transporter (DMT)-like permease
LSAIAAALFSYWVLGETLTVKGWIGAGLVVLAIVLGRFEKGPVIVEESSKQQIDEVIE